MNSCLLCGVGGQGTVLASKLIAYAALEKGQNVRTAETIGMAQRGGCVVSHVRVGDVIYSPLIPKKNADIMIAFEPAEAVRCLSYLKKNGTVVVNNKAVKPVTDTLSGSSYDGSKMLDYLKENVHNLIIVDGEQLCNECGSSKVLNIIMLACAVKTGCLSMNMDELKEAVKQKIPSKFQELNLKAVSLVESTNFNK